MTLKPLLPSPLLLLAQKFESAGTPLYVVGGFVRNALLKLPVSDVDICSSLVAEKVLSLLKESSFKAVPMGGACGTLAITCEKETYEYTPFRQDVYHKGYHRPTDVVFGVTREQDAQRRDFTVNALYYDICKDEIYDNVGGLQDLAQRKLRAVKDPGLVFGEDGLRILRLVRFACELGFTIDEDTLASAKAHHALLKDIAPERIRDELCKILLSDIKYPELHLLEAPETGILLLKEVGVLCHMLPELCEGLGVMQRKDFHAYDVFTHNVKTMSFMPPVLYLRLAGLLHDIGKPYCLDEKGRMTGHDEKGAEMAAQRLEALRFDRDTLIKVQKLILSHMYDLDGRARTHKVRRYFAKIGFDTAKDLSVMRGADVRGSGYALGETPTERKFKTIYEQMMREGVPDSPNGLALSGEEIMAFLHMTPGKEVGEIKKQLYDEVVLRPDLNTPDALRLKLQRLLDKTRGKNP